MVADLFEMDDQPRYDRPAAAPAVQPSALGRIIRLQELSRHLEGSLQGWKGQPPSAYVGRRIAELTTHLATVAEEILILQGRMAP